MKKKKTKQSTENLVIYTDPSFPLDEENIFHSCHYYKSFGDFERNNLGSRALILIPKAALPRSYRKNQPAKEQEGE